VYIYERPSIMNFVTFHRSEILTPILQAKSLLLNHCTTFHIISSQFVRRLLDIKYRPLLFPSYTIIPQHPTILPSILALKLQHRLRCTRVQNEVVVTMWAVFIAILEFLRVFSEAFFTFLACERHIEFLEEGMGFVFGMTFWAVIPFSTAGGADGYLGVEDVLTHVEL